jgi:hypothetical protein
MVHAPMGTLAAITAEAGWGDEPFSLLTLVDWASVLAYEPDLDALAVDLVEAATRSHAHRLIIAISDPIHGQEIVARLQVHPIITGWLEIRFQILPRSALRRKTAMVVIDGQLQMNVCHALPRQVQETFSIGRYAVLATATGVKGLTVDNEASERLFYQMNQAIGCRTTKGQAVDMIILVAEESQETALRRAAWLTRQMIESIPVHFATVRRLAEGGYRLKRQF